MYLGIDFGTCNSSAALLLDGTLKRIAEPLKHDYCFPSSVFVTAHGEILVGHAAENARQQDPQRYCHEFKRYLGEDVPYFLGECQKLPEELVTEVIRKLKTEADLVVKGRGMQPLSNAIITVPATYQAYKRGIMQQAGIKAGFSQVELLEEPVAAAIYYSRHAPVKEGEIILVYDLGGGTFDATLIQKRELGYKILAMPKGLPQCGGRDFDKAIYEDLKQQCSEFLRQQLEDKKDWRSKAFVGDFCRQLKHQLSEAEEAQIYIPIGDGESYTLTRQVFNGMIEPLIGETIDCCDQLVRSAGIEWRQVNQVLLVGGSSRIPYVQETVEGKFGRPHLLVDEPELAVCLGAAIGEGTSPPTPPPTVPIPSPLEEAEVYFKRGEEKFQAEDYVGAIAQFNQAIQLNPNYAEVYYARALVRQNLGDVKGSVEDLQEAANLFLNQSHFPEYQKTLDKIKEVNKPYSPQPIPSEPTPTVQLTVEELYQQGLTYINQENYKMAIEQFEQVLHAQPRHVGVYLHRGVAYFCLGDYQQTIDDSNQVISIDCKCSDAYVSRGFARFSLGEHQGAIRDLNQALQMDVNNCRAYLGRSLIRAFFGDHKGAIADYNRLKQLDIQFNNSEHNKVLSLAVQGNKGDIIQYIKKAIQRLFIPLKYPQNSAVALLNSKTKTNISQNTDAGNQYQIIQVYLSNKKQHFIAEGFEWKENLSCQNFSFQAVAQGIRKLQLIPWDTFFVFSEFLALDMYTFRHFVRESFKYCGTLRGTNIKIKGILCYPVALVENLDIATAIAIQKEPPGCEIDELTRMSYILPLIFDLKTQNLHLSEQRPLIAWAVWSGVKKIAQDLLL